MACPLSNTRRTAASISSLRSRYWAWMSQSGTGGGAVGFTAGSCGRRSGCVLYARPAGRVKPPCRGTWAGGAVRVARETVLSHTSATVRPDRSGGGPPGTPTRSKGLMPTTELEPFDVDATGPDYLNAAARLETALSSEELLRCLQAIELAHGRERPFVNASRTL
ncbi:MAG: 2-amino-4-hydroxy-6-hydroxymethyldihydropteridine diphosphokinase, partial [Gemmataceae bacterium]|nr:2-amino-4-hydroxy-6-hydroxymethyldihydropteridine diphosphokinase [Gemmataceae bacterium]